MADDNFFKPEENAEVATEIEKVKVGEKEYSQDELSKLVGLGEKWTETETKFNTKMDRVVPEYTKATQKIKEYEAELAELKKPREEPKTGDLTPEQKDEARKQIFELIGDKPMTQKEFDTLYMQRRSAERLLEDTESVVTEAKEAGNPQTDVESLLRHMEETGIKNPKKAYKDMFEPELDKIKEQKLRSIKPHGLQTMQTSTAGSKQPEKVKVTRDNISDLLRSTLNRG